MSSFIKERWCGKSGQRAVQARGVEGIHKDCKQNPNAINAGIRGNKRPVGGGRGNRVGRGGVGSREGKTER